jgi:TatD DNase family protein
VVISRDSAVAEPQASLIDTHAHLDFSQFDDDRDQVMERAAAEGVVGVVTVGFDLNSSRQAVAIADGHANVWACVGVHPHEASQVDLEVMNDLRELSDHPKVVGIGEIGLDYYRDRSPREVQRQVFRRELELAAEVGKPVVVHDRDAHQDVIAIVRDWSRAVSSAKGSLRPPLGVLHCYSGDLAMAEELCQLGFYISVAGPVTYPSAGRLRELASQIPLGRLLVETDCPFLPPHPHRGKRNEPANVKLVAAKMAEIKSISLQEMSDITTQNARTVLRLQ